MGQDGGSVKEKDMDQNGYTAPEIVVAGLAISLLALICFLGLTLIKACLKFIW